MGLLDFTINGFPLFREKLFIADKYYHILKEQREGELDLVNISRTAKREDHWTYFNKASFWIHPSGEHHEEHDPETGRVTMSVQTNYINLQNHDITKYLGDAATEYHIHPDEAVNYYFKCKPENDLGQGEYMKSFLMHPSRADLMNSLKFDDRTHKIATSLGITTYQLKSAELFEKRNLERMMVKCQPPFIGSDKPFDEWLGIYVNNMKDELGNYATLDFCHKSWL